jgi:hypothetical protein
VRVEVAAAPAQLTDCNCSICLRLGALWAYYSPKDVKITGQENTDPYVRKDRPDVGGMAFYHCRTCGCTSHWRARDPAHDRMGVNARLFPPEALREVRVRRFDGAEGWKFLD